MLRYYYLNKEWMLSRRARRIYRVAASLSLSLFLMMIVLRSAGEISPNIIPLLKLLLLLSVLGAATTMVAMEYFLFGFDNSSSLAKVFWFCVMLFPPLGPALYCFVVYSRSSAIEPASQQRAAGN